MQFRIAIIIAQISLQSPRSAPIAIGVAALVLAAIVWLYPVQLRDVAWPWRGLLPILRGVTVVALAAALLKPVAVRSASSAERGSVLVLLDRSRSMSVTDNSRSPAQLVALADSLQKLPAGARTDVGSNLASALERVRSSAAAVKAALDDLDYARVSGREIDLRQSRVHRAYADYTEAAHTLSTRAEGVDPESDLHLRLAALTPIPAIDARETWKTELPANISRAIDAVQLYQNASDEQLYQSRADVRQACDEVAAMSRFDLASAALLRSGGLLSRLRAEADVQVFSVADTVQPLDVPTKAATQPVLHASADGYTTDLTRSISEVATGRNVRAIVLLSDGRQVSGDSTVVSGLAPGGVPVFTVAAAAPAAPRDLSFATVRIPSAVFAGQRFMLRADLRHEGINNMNVEVHLQTPQVQDQVKTAAIREGRRASAYFPMELSQIGAQKLRLWFNKAEGEISDANNLIERWVKVVPQRMHVMLIAGSPGWDFQFVRNALERSPELQVREITIRPGGRLQGLARGDILAQDVLVLFDPPMAAFDAAQWDEVEQLAERRGGSVILVAGSHLPVEYGKAAPIPVSKLLPYRVFSYTPAWRVWPGAAPQFHFVPSQLGESLDALRPPEGENQSADAINSHWEQLPGAYRFVQLPVNDAESWKPDAHELLVESDSRLPVLTEMRVGLGRAFFLGTNETWRWRYKIGERNQDHFWRQLITYASEPPYFARTDRLALDADKVAAEPGETVHIRARLSDERLGTSRAEQLEILRDGKLFAARPLDPTGPAGSGRFAGTVNLPIGQYMLRWSVPNPRGPTFSVQIPLHIAANDEAELADLSGDERMLRKIADATGGEFMTIDRIGNLPDRLFAISNSRVRVAELRLWDSPILFCFIVGCLGIEWAIRKRAGLA
ncbi:MAG TPA: hypothetical protein VH370_04205 [Humisphaera sp.]|jgi:hypothetical protein|nr:hypothetical protein [Humisphaera sp.]